MAYIGRHTARLKATTKSDITTTPSVIFGKSPAAVLWAMYAPKPWATTLSCPHETNSETILAFHAPPEAVIAPVTYYAKMPGSMTLRHHSQPRMRKLAATSLKSFGNALAPAITLNRMYHCVPSTISGLSHTSGFNW